MAAFAAFATVVVTVSLGNPSPGIEIKKTCNIGEVLHVIHD